MQRCELVCVRSFVEGGRTEGLVGSILASRHDQPDLVRVGTPTRELYNVLTYPHCTTSFAYTTAILKKCHSSRRLQKKLVKLIHKIIQKKKIIIIFQFAAKLNKLEDFQSTYL